MGNCQAAEAATVVIVHPGKKLERIYWSVSAQDIMTSNPGNYVALVVSSPMKKWDNGTPVKHLKLLRPNDTLLIGHVYRLISFEDVLKEFAEKKCGKLGKLLEQGGIGLEKRKISGVSRLNSNTISANIHSVRMEHRACRVRSSNNGRGFGRHQISGEQWQPALQSISELGT
ncbi:hypothetical protein NMG60_11005988 [Bertholletia excelsa]